MNKMGLIALVVPLVGGGLLAAFIGYGVYKGDQLDASSKAYVERNVPPIISTWSENALLTRASPRLRGFLHAHHEQVDRLFHNFSTLGTVQSFGDVTGQSNILLTTQHGLVITANYVGDAKFTHGKARVIVRLVRLAGHWKFLYMHVNGARDKR